MAPRRIFLKEQDDAEDDSIQPKRSVTSGCWPCFCIDCFDWRGTRFLIYRKRPLLEMPRLLEHKYYVDEIYDAAIIHPIEAGSREGLWKLFDQEVIDGFLHALGRTVTETGGVVRYLQMGLSAVMRPSFYSARWRSSGFLWLLRR